MRIMHVLLTGPPGIGKTTLIEKLCDVLKERSIPLTGFVTKELRQNNERVGFDVVTLDGKRSPLARARSTMSGPRVGKYVVDVNSFEAIALPLLRIQEGKKQIYVIDEIGKMELFSYRFMRNINEIFGKTGDFAPVVLGSIPIKRGKEIAFVEDIRRRSNVKVFEISRENRDIIVSDIAEYVMSNFTPTK